MSAMAEELGSGWKRRAAAAALECRRRGTQLWQRQAGRWGTVVVASVCVVKAWKLVTLYTCCQKLFLNRQQPYAAFTTTR